MRIHPHTCVNSCLQSFSQESGKHYSSIRREELCDGDEEREGRMILRALCPRRPELVGEALLGLRNLPAPGPAERV